MVPERVPWAITSELVRQNMARLKIGLNSEYTFPMNIPYFKENQYNILH